MGFLENLRGRIHITPQEQYNLRGPGRTKKYLNISLGLLFITKFEIKTQETLFEIKTH